MTAWIQSSNNSTSKLANQLNQGDTSMVLLDGSSFPSVYPYILNVNNLELVTVSNKSGNTFTITRGSESTSDQTHLANKSVKLVFTAATLTQLQTEITNLQIGKQNTLNITGTHTIDTSVATTYYCTASTVNYNVNLPALSSENNGTILNIKKIDSTVYTITIDANGSDTIDGENTYVLELPNEFVIISANYSSTRWQVIAE